MSGWVLNQFNPRNTKHRNCMKWYAVFTQIKNMVWTSSIQLLYIKSNDQPTSGNSIACFHHDKQNVSDLIILNPITHSTMGQYMSIYPSQIHIEPMSIQTYPSYNNPLRIQSAEICCNYHIQHEYSFYLLIR